MRACLRGIVLLSTMLAVSGLAQARIGVAILTRTVEDQPFAFSFSLLSDEGDSIPYTDIYIDLNGQTVLDGTALLQAVEAGAVTMQTFPATGTVRIDIPSLRLPAGEYTFTVGFSQTSISDRVTLMLWSDGTTPSSSAAATLIQQYAARLHQARWGTLSLTTDGFTKPIFDSGVSISEDAYIALVDERNRLAAAQAAMGRAVGVIEDTPRGRGADGPRKGALRNAGFWFWGATSSSATKQKNEIITTIERMSDEDKRNTWEQYVQTAEGKAKEFYLVRSNGDRYTDMDDYLSDLKSGTYAATGRASYQVANWKECETFGHYADRPHLSHNIAQTGGELCQKGAKVYVAAVKMAGGPLGAVVDAAEKTVEIAEKTEALINDPAGTLKDMAIDQAKGYVKGKVLGRVADATGVDADDLEAFSDGVAETYDQGRTLYETFGEGKTPENKGALSLTGEGAPKVEVGIVVDAAGDSIGLISNSGGGTPPTVSVTPGSASVITVQDTGGVTEKSGVTLTTGQTTVVSVPLSADVLTASVGDKTVAAGQAFTLTASAAGGMEPYEFTWSSGGQELASGASLSIPEGVLTEPGAYGVQVAVRDATGTTVIASATVTVRPALTVAVTGALTVATSDPVSLTAVVSGGVEPYAYAWSSSGVTLTTDAILSYDGGLLVPAAYPITLTVTDAEGAVGVASVTLTVGAVELRITSPANGSETDQVAQLVTGTVAGAELVTTLGLMVNGALQQLPVASSFSQNVALIPGENTVTAVAQLADGSVVASQTIRILSTQPVDNLYHIRLTWTTGGTDVDLHLTAPDGSTCYYGNQNPGFGAALDFDDTDGYGPENITVGNLTQRGTYTIKVHYYSDHDGENDIRSTATVQIFMLGQAIYSDSRTLSDGEYWTVFSFTW